MMKGDKAVELKRAANRALAGRRYDEAKQSFSRLIDRFPDRKEGFVGLAKVYERTGEHQATVELLEPVWDRLGSAQVLRLLGDAHRVLANRGRAGHAERALDAYGRYHEERDDPVSLFYAGDLLEKLGRYEDAREAFEASWAADPRSREAYAGTLRCLKKLGREDEIGAMKERWQVGTG